MPGLYHIINDKNYSLENNKVKEYLKTHADIKFTDICISQNNNLFVFANQNYPIKTWRFLDYDVVFLGMIYNIQAEIIQNKINEIITSFNSSGDYKYLIQSFVKESDGDFIIYAFSEISTKGILFNDILGRLPIYFYSDGKRVSICSEQKGVIHNIPKIEIDKYEVLNMIMFSYTLGENTMYKNVKRLLAGKILTFKNDYKIFQEDSYSNIFNDKPTFRSKRKTIEHIASVFSEALKNRVDTLKTNNYRLIADLTGGFDSRIVFGALANYTKDVGYFTFEYIQDESIIAKDLFDNLGSAGGYTKLKYSNKLNKSKLGDIVYKTDGLCNYYTTYICYNDLDYLYNYIPNEKTARFGGLGGEFFRHPFKRYYKNLFYGIENGFYNESFNSVFSLINLDKVNYVRYMQVYIDRNYSESKDKNLKTFYLNEYYRIQVGLNAEDRERIHFWSIHPLWSKDLINIFINEFPLKWANYDFFTKLINEIDMRLLDTPIYNRSIKLKNYFNRKKYDFLESYRNQYKHEILHFFKNKTKGLYELVSRIIHENKRRIENNSVDELPYSQLYNKLIYTKHVFNIEFINTLAEENKNLSTIMIYFEELEKRYPEKFN